MSSYFRETKHPETGEWQSAQWIDDLLGRHHYGVKFPDGMVFDPWRVKLETRPEEAATECEVEEAYPNLGENGGG